jgi:uncharacterized zinc-type alcohol dehydrogenase-like protein
LTGRKSLSGSLIGELKKTLKMLDFCGAHNLNAAVEAFPCQTTNQTYEHLV